jgi:hypothetical protein
MKGKESVGVYTFISALCRAIFTIGYTMPWSSLLHKTMLCLCHMRQADHLTMLVLTHFIEGTQSGMLMFLDLGVPVLSIYVSMD